MCRRLRLFLTWLERANVVGHPAQRSTAIVDTRSCDPSCAIARAISATGSPAAIPLPYGEPITRSPRSDTTINVDANGHTALPTVVRLPQMLSSRILPAALRNLWVRLGVLTS
jgi:hypothetical protein